MTSRPIVTLVLAFIFAPVASACGGSDNATAMGASGSGPTNSAGAGGVTNSAGTSNSAGSAGSEPPSHAGTGGMGTAGTSTSATGVIEGDGKPFVPDDIEYSLVDSGNALTLLAATVIHDSDGYWYWTAALRNDEPNPLCGPELNAIFTASSTGNELITGNSPMMILGPMYHSSGTLDAPCLQPGEIGMGAAPIDLSPTEAVKVVKIEYQPRGYLDFNITKLPALAVGPLAIESSAAGNVVTGSVTNPNASAVPGSVQVAIFPLDSGGRPIDFGYANSDADLAAGSSWTFTTTIASPINKYAAFAVYEQTPP